MQVVLTEPKCNGSTERLMFGKGGGNCDHKQRTKWKPSLNRDLRGVHALASEHVDSMKLHPPGSLLIEAFPGSSPPPPPNHLSWCVQRC